MRTAPTIWRRVLALFLSLVLTTVSVALAHAAPLSAPSLQGLAPTEAAQSTESDSLKALAEAYVLLLERYAVPLDSAGLAKAGNDGLDAALA